MIDPAAAVMLTAPAVALVVIAEAPKLTLRPALKVIVPDEEVSVDAIVISPMEVLDVKLILTAVDIAALI